MKSQSQYETQMKHFHLTETQYANDNTREEWVPCSRVPKECHKSICSIKIISAYIIFLTKINHTDHANISECAVRARLARCSQCTSCVDWSAGRTKVHTALDCAMLTANTRCDRIDAVFSFHSSPVKFINRCLGWHDFIILIVRRCLSHLLISLLPIRTFFIIFFFFFSCFASCSAAFDFILRERARAIRELR